jgi:hypothetical protein
MALNNKAKTSILKPKEALGKDERFILAQKNDGFCFVCILAVQCSQL